MALSSFLNVATKKFLNYTLRSNSKTVLISRRLNYPLATISRSMCSSDSEPTIIYGVAKIVPDVVSTSPKLPTEVRYDSAVVNMGNELTPTMVRNPPSYIHWPVEQDSLYTLCLTDPDAPSREDPKFREWLHWLVVNIPDGTDVKSGTILAEYIGAAPPKGAGLHRYVFLVYKQTKKLDCDEKLLMSNTAEGRGNFKIEDFAKKYELGDPIAGNFFHARWDAYVATIEKQLSN